MLINILLRGGKKFRELILIEVNIAITGIQRHRGFSVFGFVDDDFLSIHI
jgi:hypothetical protein